MQRRSGILGEFSCLAAALMFSLGCGSATAIAQPTSICTLTGPAAAVLLDLFNPSVPVLVAGVGGNPVPILLTRDEGDAASLLKTLFSTDPVENCDLEGGTACCNSVTHKMVLSATYEAKPGWLRMGELCVAPKAVARPGIDFVPVPETVSMELNAQCGVDDCFMELSDENGEPVVAVNAPSRSSPLWAYCFMHLTNSDDSTRAFAYSPAKEGSVRLTSWIMRRPVLRANPQIIPAKHVHSPPPPPRCQSAAPDHCNNGSEITYKRCRPDVRHWYKYSDSTDDWCQLTSKCKCPSP